MEKGEEVSRRGFYSLWDDSTRMLKRTERMNLSIDGFHFEMLVRGTRLLHLSQRVNNDR